MGLLALDRWIDCGGNLACFSLMVISNESLVKCDCTVAGDFLYIGGTST